MRKAVARKYESPNNVVFPRKLRDAIPDQELCMGRCLKLDSADAQILNTLWGKRVQVTLRVCETGKLTGVFDVLVDLNVEAAKALAEVLENAAATSGKQT